MCTESNAGVPWRWSEGQSRWTGLPSPPLAPAGDGDIDERGSFLNPRARHGKKIDNYTLDSEHASPRASNNMVEPIPPTSLMAPAIPLERRTSKELGGMIQSAFDEMDAALASRDGNQHNQHGPALNVHAPEFVPTALREWRGGTQLQSPAASSQHSWGSPTDGQRNVWGTPPYSSSSSSNINNNMNGAGPLPWGTPPGMMMMEGMEPTDEEQAWLDAQCEAVDDAAAMDAEADQEESWVRRQMQQHPTLAEEEARVLYDCRASPDMYAMDDQ